MRGQIEKLQRDVEAREATRTEVSDQLRQSEKAISEINRHLQELTKEQRELDVSLKNNRAAIQSTQTDMTRQQELMNRSLRQQYMHGNPDPLKIILNGGNLADVERHLHYLGALSQQRARQIEQLRVTSTKLTELEAAHLQHQGELTANAEKQLEARRALEQQRISRKKVLDQVAVEIKRNRREIGRLKRDEDRLTRLIADLSNLIAQNRRQPRDKAQPALKPGQPVDVVADASFAGKSFSTLKGKLKLPVRGELTGRFGAQREEGGVTWRGLFIRATSGAPVHVVADGRVVFADWFRGFGNLMIVDHGGDYLSLYGNNEALLKQVGETVQSGNIIAAVGASGGAAESGVYFELRHEGAPFDPMKWVGK